MITMTSYPIVSIKLTKEISPLLTILQRGTVY